MNRYDPNIPRKRLAVCTLAASALTVALLVGAPAHIGGPRADAATVVTTLPSAREPTLVVIEPSTIEVVGVRDDTVALSSPATVLDLQLVARAADEAKRLTSARGESSLQ